MLRDRAVPRHHAAAICLVACMLGLSCASFGPRKLQSSHLNYNIAVQKAQMEEDLLNIVRLRYGDMPVALSVSSISAQTSFSVGTGGEFGLVEGESSAAIRPGIGYTDQPTITFAPHQGREYLESLTEPVSLETLVHLETSQVAIDTVLRVGVANVNGIQNRVDSASPDFDRMAAGLRALETESAVRTGFLDHTVLLSEPIPADSVDADALLEAARDGYRFEPDGNGGYRLTAKEPAPFLWIDSSGAATQELFDELRLTKNMTRFEMKMVEQVKRPSEPTEFISVRTRSILEIANYLSHGVDVPDAHDRAGVARPTSDSEPNLSGLFRVRVSRTRPEEPGIAVQYRDHWYFIPDSDHPSKATFALLQALLLSQTTEDPNERAPVLTLPLN